jgi:rfaE bifunctional protein kinase chain/domain
MNRDIDGFMDHARSTTVLVVGDVMLDAYLWGRVDRISPEAPVPVVHVQRRSARLGGAANVALNLHAMGARPVVVSTIGNDAAGNDLVRECEAAGLTSAGLVRSTQRPTTVKTRVISGHQHVVRVDEESNADLDSAEEDALLARLAEVMDHYRPAALVIEDYNKGVLTERTIAGVLDLAQRHSIPVTVDPKLKNFLCYRGVALFKPNLKELREGLKVDVRGYDLDGVRAAVERLERELGNTATLVTLSEHGVFAHAHGTEHHIAAHPRRIVDVSGAGDTVIAVATLALAQGLPLDRIAALSNLAGGLVCEEVGVAPIDRERFRREAAHAAILP